MDGKDLVNITVLIAGRPYPLKIKSTDEPAIRRIVKEVNEKINHFQLTYNKKDKQDCLSMALLTYAVDLHKSQQESEISEEAELSTRIQQLDELVSAMLD